MASIHYPNEKLSDAVYQLATGAGDVRSRLYSILDKIIILPEYSLPTDLKDELLWIKNKLTEKDKTQYGNDRGRTIRRMKNSTGSKIAERIVDLQSRICDLIEEEDETK